MDSMRRHILTANNTQARTFSTCRGMSSCLPYPTSLVQWKGSLWCHSFDPRSLDQNQCEYQFPKMIQEAQSRYIYWDFLFVCLFSSSYFTYSLKSKSDRLKCLTFISSSLYLSIALHLPDDLSQWCIKLIKECVGTISFCHSSITLTVLMQGYCSNDHYVPTWTWKLTFWEIIVAENTLHRICLSHLQLGITLFLFIYLFWDKCNEIYRCSISVRAQPTTTTSRSLYRYA